MTLYVLTVHAAPFPDWSFQRDSDLVVGTLSCFDRGLSDMSCRSRSPTRRLYRQRSRSLSNDTTLEDKDQDARQAPRCSLSQEDVRGFVIKSVFPDWLFITVSRRASYRQKRSDGKDDSDEDWPSKYVSLQFSYAHVADCLYRRHQREAALA